MMLQDLPLSLLFVHQTVSKQLHKPTWLLSCLHLAGTRDLTGIIHLVYAVAIYDSDFGTLRCRRFVDRRGESWLGCSGNLLNLFISSFDKGLVPIFKVKGCKSCFVILAETFMDCFQVTLAKRRLFGDQLWRESITLFLVELSPQ